MVMCGNARQKYHLMQFLVFSEEKINDLSVIQ